MFRLAFLAALVGIAYSAGCMWHALAAWLAWIGLKATRRGGLAAGVQAVAMKIAFLMLMIFAVHSDRVHGTAAVGVFLLGLLGLNINVPTIRFRSANPDRSISPATPAQATGNGLDSLAEPKLEASLPSAHQKDSGNIGDLRSVISFAMRRK